MSLSKLVTGLIILATNETTYGLGAALTGSLHTIQVAEAFPIFNIEYSFDGDRKGANYSGGSNRRTTPSGKTVKGKVKIEGKGLGSAYSLSATPPNLHPFLISSGLSGSFQSNTWVYKPLPLGTTAVGTALEVYDRGERLSISGAFCNMTFANDGAGMTNFEFDLMGIPAGSITDVATPPARVFNAFAVIPPKNELVALAVGSYTGSNVRSYEYGHGLEISPRQSLNASGSFGGYAIGRRKPTFKVVMEADALASYDPYTDWTNGVARNLSFTVGVAGTNNSFTVAFPTASIARVERTNEGNTLALWSIEYAPAVSTPDASDDMALTFNA